MEKDEDNIQFDQMPDLDWNWGKAPKSEIVEVEKEYDSLFDELLDKCNPSKFKGMEQFSLANEIYAQLRQKDKETVNEKDLRHLRNRVIDELGLHISTTREFNRLKAFLDPDNYINRQPYDKDLVENAGKLYSQLLQNKDDIKALELLENLPETVLIHEEYEFQNLEPDDYLKKYPNGKYVEEVEMTIWKKENSSFENLSATEYLRQNPNGQYADEARCFLSDGSKSYLKQYPQGRYKDDAESDIVSNRIIAVVGILFFIVIIIAVVIGSN